MNQNGSTQKSFLCARNILKILSVLCLAFAFCPSFFVSCAGGTNIYVAHGVHGTDVSRSHPIMLLCYLVPVIAIVILFVKRIADKKGAGIILTMFIIDMIIWIAFRASVKRIAESNYCSFNTTEWYVFNMICMILIILVSVLVALGFLTMDAHFASIISKADKAKAMDQMTETVSRMSSAVSQIASSASTTIGSKIVSKEGISGYCCKCGSAICLGQKYSQEEIIGYCSKCGSALSLENKYCSSCGFPVPESMIVDAEEKKKELEKRREEERIAEEKRRLAEEQQRLKALEEQQKLQEVADKKDGSSNKATIFCPYCGTKLDGDSVFCSNCGKKVD